MIPPPIHPALRYAMAVLAACAVFGCSPKKTAPTEPPGSALSPVVIATFPEARSTGIRYDTEIWADFAEPLDSSTVNATSVFLKIDTQRVPATIVYESAARRVRIVPVSPLALRRTHTVEFTSRVRTVSGGAFPETWFWQFTTNSLRVLDPPFPPDGATATSPVAPRMWGVTESSAGDVVYHVFSGSDSAEVAARSGVPVNTARGYLLTPQRWMAGTRTWWTVRAENRTTGEILDSDVWHFDVVPADAPIDSLVVPFGWWGLYVGGSRPQRACSPTTLTTGASYLSVVRWRVDFVPPATRVARLVLLATTTGIVDVNTRVPSVYATTAPVRDECFILLPGPPYSDDLLGPLAIARNEVDNVLRFETDLFASHLQATLLDPQRFAGYIFRSGPTMSYTSMTMKLYYYLP